MRDISGIEVLDRVNSTTHIEALMIIAPVSLDVLEGLPCGFDYVMKPFDVNTVLSLVEHGLRRRSTAEVFYPAGTFPQRWTSHSEKPKESLKRISGST
jgi:DNA-binding response OmpR family regulator